MIHYHGADMTGTNLDLTSLARRHAMVSFSTPNIVGNVAEICQSFALDNGAFSAWRSGKPVTDWRPYYQWVADICRHPGCDWVLIPDVIDGTEQENDDQIAHWCDDPTRRSIGVPVWHLHESLSRLDNLVSGFPRRWNRIALGSSGDYSNPASSRWWTRIAEAMEVACTEDGRPRVKLHGLRMLNPTIFSHLPLASADSINATRTAAQDDAWTGSYPPITAGMRATVIMERVELHASANRWNHTGGIQQNLGLVG